MFLTFCQWHRISKYFFIVRILHPLPDVAAHVVKTERIRREGFHGGRLREAVAVARDAGLELHGEPFDARELPDDIDALSIPVLSHRLIATGRIASTGAIISGASVPDIVARIVADTPVPLGIGR